MTSADATPTTDCPPAEQLACFLDGSLPSASVSDLETHLSTCDRCCSIVADLVGHGFESIDGD